ncbi:MAG: hypothetical protein WC455_15400 [Dehalococcoidia bacterium]|jgi:ribosomal protein S27AE
MLIDRDMWDAYPEGAHFEVNEDRQVLHHDGYKRGKCPKCGNSVLYGIGKNDGWCGRLECQPTWVSSWTCPNTIQEATK